MALYDFPTTGLVPNVTTHTIGERTWVWTGVGWEISSPVPTSAFITFTDLANALEGVRAFESGTRMLFVQSAAPTGWTKDATHNDKALRVVSGTAGSGGSTAFSTVMASRTPTGSVNLSGLSVGATTLTIAQIPSHNHAVYTYDPDGYYAPEPQAESYPGTRYSDIRYTQNTGGGNSHTHSLSGSGSVSFGVMDFAVQYVDVIIATKD